MRIAVIGTGISGNAAAWALSADHELVVYEKEPRLGGHAHTVDIDYLGRPIAVDTGFIVYNELNWPNMTALFAHLGVRTQASDTWVERLAPLGIVVAKVDTLEGALGGPLARERAMVVDLPCESARLRAVGSPIKFSGVQAAYGPPPLLGEHTQAVLAGCGATLGSHADGDAKA